MGAEWGRCRLVDGEGADGCQPSAAELVGAGELLGVAWGGSRLVDGVGEGADGCQLLAAEVP
ncbi:hypothetical protein GCM10010195_70410 [Kitasatospora griseola]|nr:hypothetical protein GCM10010195_70410 [Kitasatospora griseola]